MTVAAQLRLERVSLVSKQVTEQQPDSAGDGAFLLQDLSLTVQPGDRIALVGASGAGKTLLLRLLNRLIEPTHGTIYLAGQPYCQIPAVQLRQQVVLVLQESKLLGMTVQQALEYPLSLRGLPPKAIRQRVSEWLERLAIPGEWLDRTELQLSVGQRQLVAIARALVIQPQILLLDEPTSALDVGRSQRLVEVLKTLVETQQTTIIMASHQLDVMQGFCDRLLQLHHGKLLQNLPASEVNWHDLRQSLVQAQARQPDEWGE